MFQSRTTTVAENQRIWGGGNPLWIAMNIHSMKLFNNLIKNTLLALMFCGLVKSHFSVHYQPDTVRDVILKAYSCSTLNQLHFDV